MNLENFKSINLNSQEDLKAALLDMLKTFVPNGEDKKWFEDHVIELQNDVSKFPILNWIVDVATLACHQDESYTEENAFYMFDGMARGRAGKTNQGKNSSYEYVIKTKAGIGKYEHTMELTPEDLEVVKRKMAIIKGAGKHAVGFYAAFKAMLPSFDGTTKKHLKSHSSHNLFGFETTDKIASGEILRGELKIEDLKRYKPRFYKNNGDELQTSFVMGETDIIEISKNVGLISQADSKDGSIFNVKHPLMGSIGGVDNVPMLQVHNVILDLMAKIQKMTTETQSFGIFASEKFYNFSKRKSLNRQIDGDNTLHSLIGQLSSFSHEPYLDYIKDFDGFIIVPKKLVKTNMSALFETDPTVKELHNIQKTSTNSSVACPTALPGSVILVNGIFSDHPNFAGAKPTMSARGNANSDSNEINNQLLALAKQVKETQDELKLVKAKNEGENEVVNKLVAILEGKSGTNDALSIQKNQQNR